MCLPNVFVSVVVEVIVLGSEKSRSPLVVDINSDDLEAKSKLKLSSLSRSEFSSSFGASMSEASSVSFPRDEDDLDEADDTEEAGCLLEVVVVFFVLYTLL